MTIRFKELTTNFAQLQNKQLMKITELIVWP